MESLRTTCPKEVAACEADADCMEELLSSFASQEASPELPSDLLVAVFQCFNANAEMAHSCPREMEVCEATAGCVDELQAAVTAVAPPTEGSEELMAVVECLKRVSAERASAQQGADAAGGGGHLTIEEVRMSCPEEVATCEADSDCKEEFRGSLTGGAPPASGPSDLLQKVIRCFRENAEQQRQQKTPADSCPTEMEICEETEGCVDELQAALSAVTPPTEGSEELMAVVECLKGGMRQ